MEQPVSFKCTELKRAPPPSLQDRDACYGTCGVRQAFCDQQLQNCVYAKVSMPECHTAIDTTGLLAGQLSCSAFEAAQVRARR